MVCQEFRGEKVSGELGNLTVEIKGKYELVQNGTTIKFGDKSSYCFKDESDDSNESEYTDNEAEEGEWYGMNGMALTLIIRAFYLPKDSKPFSFYCVGVNKRSIS